MSIRAIVSCIMALAVLSVGCRKGEEGIKKEPGGRVVLTSRGEDPHPEEASIPGELAGPAKEGLAAKGSSPTEIASHKPGGPGTQPDATDVEKRSGRPGAWLTTLVKEANPDGSKPHSNAASEGTSSALAEGAAGRKARQTEVLPPLQSAKEKKISDVLPPPGAPAPGEGVVAWSRDLRIDAETFRVYLSRLPTFQRRECSSLEKKKELLKKLIQFETLAEIARKEGMADDPEVLLAAKTEMVKKLLHVKFGDPMAVKVSEEEIAARYERDRNAYNKPEKVRASQIFIKDRAVAERVLKELKKRLSIARTNTRAIFREFVRKYSEDPVTKQRGGDMLFFSRSGVESGEDKVDRAVAEAAFSMHNIDQVSGLIRGEEGYHILLLTDRRERVEKPLSEVREEIKSAIAMEKLDANRRAFIESVVDFNAWKIELRELDKVEIEFEPAAQRIKARVDSIKGKEKPKLKEGK